MKLKIKKLDKNAVIPVYASSGAACFDLVATSMETMMRTDQVKYGIGLAFEIPEGYKGIIYPRSSVVKTCLRLGNNIGVIDSDYRGEVTMVFDNDLNSKLPIYQVGDRIGQMEIVPVLQVEFEEVEDLTNTERGSGGYGSTGK